jgi:uncharacterized protein (DUF58 family)
MMIEKKHLSLRPTRHGLLFLVILGAMMAGSVNYNNNAGFILVFLLGGMALISLFHSRKNLAGLGIVFVSAPPVFAGDTARFIFEVQSNGPERAGLTLALPRQTDPLETTLDRNEIKRVHLPLKTATRGIVRPGPLTVSSVYPFGLFRLQTRIPVPLTCLVYPAPADGPAIEKHGGGLQDGTAAGRDAGPDDFQGLSVYLPGQDIGRIYWKALSRGQGVFVKHFTAGAGGDLMLDFDAIPSPDTEYKLSRLCRMVVSADRRNIAYGLKLPDRLMPPAQGPGHRHHCLKNLALYGIKEPDV